MIHRKCLLSLLLLVQVGFAGAAHITDKLVVGVYSGPKAEGTPLQLLSSGTPIEVLRRQDGFAEVRLVDDSTGWIEAGYVTEEKPAKAMLLETQARLRQMGMELAALREQNGADGDAVSAQGAMPPGVREAELQQALNQAESRIAELEGLAIDRQRVKLEQRELGQLRDSVREALAVLAESQDLVLQPKTGPARPDLFMRYRAWIIGPLALLIGFGLGIMFIDHRIRKRYGGFRI